MLSNDPAFPQLAFINDMPQVLHHFEKLAGCHGRWTGAEIFNIWYDFKRKLEVVYRFAGSKGNNTDAYMRVAFHPYADKGVGTKGSTVTDRPATSANQRSFIAEWQADAWVLPADPVLPAITALMDPKQAALSLTQVLEKPIEASKLHGHILKYVPEKRFVIKYSYRAGHCDVVGKLQGPRDALINHEHLMGLWNSPHRRFRMPCPLGVDAALGVRWEAFVNGLSLENSLENLDFAGLFARLSSELLNLRTLPAAKMKPNGPDQVLKRLNKRVIPKLCAAAPQLLDPAQTLGRILETTATALPLVPMGIIHGDLTVGNLLVDERGVVFIDLDNLSQGHRSYDLALFASSLLLLCMRRRTRVTEAIDTIATIPALLSASSNDPDETEELFAWYFSALLLGRQIKACLRYRYPEAPALLPLLLQLATKILEWGRLDTAGCRAIVTDHGLDRQ